MTAPGPRHPIPTVKRAIAAGDLAAIQRYTVEFGPASLQMDDDPDELTALHYAAAAGHEPLVQFLLAPPSMPMPARPGAIDSRRCTAPP